ncbi:unnamed protein product [Meloidogyne enterolobii]|uniref:Uncharacterized protein n=1 Tax=Meloidogyne enterolobii TaxID=390850 RepID=A0ACB0ZJ89_MELEN
MPSINILIISIYFIFLLFQFSASQQCSKHGSDCSDSKCCSGLNCKNTRINLGNFEYKCFKGNCVHEGNKCDDNGRGCCYGLKCNNLSSKCEKCKVNGSDCKYSSECCTGHCDSNILKCSSYS